MAGQDGGYSLGVDLGTSNTVAVLRWPDGRTRPLLFDGQPVMPSGVFADGTGRLHVGRDAQRLAQAEPARYEPNPKRRIDEPGVLLGDREVPTADLLATVLRAVAQAAVEAVGFLPPAAITYPASWGARRRAVLADAVARAGWPPVHPAVVQSGAAGPGNPAVGTRLVPEPVAAARYFSEVLRRPVPVGSALVVFDFGGGTLDIAVVRNEGVDPTGRPRFAVIGSGGVAELGGLDLDAALVGHLGQLLNNDTDGSAWRQLTQPETTTQWRNRQQFWNDVRGAKEMLSRSAVAPVPVPGVEQAVHLTREELERLAGPLLRRGVIETMSVISNCRLSPDQLAGLFLVGGSSRVPLVARLLHTELGIAPTVLEQPELPVAEGALVDLVAPPAPAAGAPVYPAPTVVAAPTGSAAPAGSPPVSPAPYLGPPGSPPAQQPAADSSPPQPVSPVPSAAPGSRKKRGLLVGIGAAVAVIVVVATALVLLPGRGYADLEFHSFKDVGQGIPAGEKESSYLFTALLDGRAYLAYQREDKRLEVIAAEAGTAKARWRKQTSATSGQWRRLVALPNALVAFGDGAGSSEQKMVVLDPADGRQRWSHDLSNKDRVFFFDDVLVHVTESRLIGRGLRDGKQRWDEPRLTNADGSSRSVVHPAITAADLAGPSGVSGASTVPDLADGRLVEIGADRSVRVIDVGSGKVLKQRTNVADLDDHVVVFEGRLYVAEAERGYRVVSYDLKSMGEPANIYTAPDDKRQPKALGPCGKDRVCLLETASYDSKTTELVAVDAAKGGALWRKPVPHAELLVPVGEHVLVRTESGERRSVIFRPDGSKLLERDGIAVRLDGGNLLIFAKQLSSYKDDPSVAGIRVGSADPVELGQLKGVRPTTCSWGLTLIVCGTDSNFVIRRFAKD
ncbi:MAG TPA: Hsp70 family protein [Micromonosporaceae bacterium]|nr:Hsp70 family protein [Micromonosporaceae bacterium]